MNNLEVVRLIEETRRLAPFSEDECRLMQLANALEDAEARVVLAKADALNEAAAVFGGYAWQDALVDAVDDVTATQGVTGWLRERAKAIEVGEI